MARFSHSSYIKIESYKLIIRIYIKRKKIGEEINGNKIKLLIYLFLIILTGNNLFKRVIATMYLIMYAYCYGMNICDPSKFIC